MRTTGNLDNHLKPSQSASRRVQNAEGAPRRSLMLGLGLLAAGSGMAEGRSLLQGNGPQTGMPAFPPPFAMPPPPTPASPAFVPSRNAPPVVLAPAGMPPPPPFAPPPPNSARVPNAAPPASVPGTPGTGTGGAGGKPSVMQILAGAPYILFNGAADGKCLTSPGSTQQGTIITVDTCHDTNDFRSQEQQQFYFTLAGGADGNPSDYTWKVLTPYWMCIQPTGTGPAGPIITQQNCSSDPRQVMQLYQLFDDTVLLAQFPAGSIAEVDGTVATIVPEQKIDPNNFEPHQIWRLGAAPPLSVTDHNANEYQLKQYRGGNCLTLATSGTVDPQVPVGFTLQPCEFASNQMFSTDGIANGVTHRIKSLALDNAGLPGAVCLDHMPVAGSQPRAFGCGAAGSDTASQEVDLLYTLNQGGTAIRFAFTETCLDAHPDTGVVAAPCDTGSETQTWQFVSLS